MEDHGPEAEFQILRRLHALLENKSVIDVGAEDGEFLSHFFDCKDARFWAFAPYRGQCDALCRRFSDDARLQVIPFALGDQGPESNLDSARCRTLGDFVDDGVVPQSTGILKLDARVGPLAVVRGWGSLHADVVVAAIGTYPSQNASHRSYSTKDLAAELHSRGYGEFALVKHRDGFVVLQRNDAATVAADRGLAIFLHERVAERLTVVFDRAAATILSELVDQAVSMRAECLNRKNVIDEQRRQIERRDNAIGALTTRTSHDRPLVIRTGTRRILRLLPGMTTIRRWVGRLAAPRLGRLEGHPPRPLSIPSWYANVPPTPPSLTISIVTPSFNQGEFLERTIRSVLDQHYPRLQYVIQDGGSTDRTTEILERYRDQLHYVESAPDRGQSHAINLGFGMTQGEIMAYLNSDDLLLPGTLHYVAEYFRTHPEVDVIYGHRIIIDEHDQEISRWVLPPHDDAVLSWADYVPQETLFWRRRIWDRVGGAVDESFQFAMDWDLLLRFRDAGAKFARVPRFCGAFRVHDRQKTERMICGVGNREMARLRRRYHGRDVTVGEIHRCTRHYLRKHVVFQKLFRLGLVRY